MILTRVTLKPFAGIPARELAFSPLLNLVLGPNEAGKTTVFQAIQAALFTRTDLSPSRLEKEMGRFMPVGSGDTASVRLEFRAQSGAYVLEKRWGPAAAPRAAAGGTELLLPDGSVLRGGDEVSAEIERLLGVREGTCRSVLMSSQAGLSRTIEDLQDPGGDTLHSLGDLLRRSIQETDGISVDRFRALVAEAWERHWSRWDVERDGPEKGRGIERPYTTKVGAVLEAYYRKENLGAQLRAAREYDDRLDALNRGLAELSLGHARAEAYLAENRTAVEAARVRKDVRLELEAASLRAAELRDANERWPVLKNRIEEHRARIEEAETRVKALVLELEKTEREMNAAASRATFRRVVERRAKLEQRRGALSKARKLTRDDLEALRSARTAFEKMSALGGAGGIRLRFHAKRPMSLKADADGAPLGGREVKEGETFELEARRGARLASAGWELEASAFTRADEPRGDPVGTLERLLTKHGVGSLEEASDANRAYEEALRAVKEAEETLAEELAGRTFEELEAEHASLGEPGESRPLAAAGGDLAAARGESGRLSAELQAAERAVADLARRHGDQNRLLLLVSDNVRRVTELEARLAGLPSPPEGAGEEGAFIAAYDAKKKERDDLKNRMQDLTLQIARLEGSAPELSSEELGGQLADAEASCERVRARGKAIARIRALGDGILNEVDGATYTGMRARLQEQLASLTGGRYTRVRMRESVPEGVLRGDGNLLAYAILSAGTRDVLALALRLAMAGYFLEGRDGFVMMDDPFANLDPDRRRRAAEAVRSFAGSRQLILFSCHPSTAELLEVEPILLG